MMEGSDNIAVQRAELGQMLRKAREEQGISLEEAEEATRIRQKYLQDIEAGEFDHLPGEVIARGFIRNYAAFLGLDATELFSVYRRALPAPAPGSEWKPPETPPKWRLEQRAVDVDLGRRTIPYARIGGMAALVVIVAFVAWQVYLRIPSLVRALTTSEPRPTPTATQAVAIADSTATPNPGADPAITLQAQATATPTRAVPTATLTPLPNATPTPGAPVVADTPVPPLTYIGVEAVVRIVGGRSWMEVTADGNIIQRGALFDPGAELTWSAVQWLRLDIGNAGAVEITINGQPLGVQGEPQQVVRRIWYLQGTQIVMYDVNPDGTPLTNPIPLPRQ